MFVKAVACLKEVHLERTGIERFSYILKLYMYIKIKATRVQFFVNKTCFTIKAARRRNIKCSGTKPRPDFLNASA